jgi:ABC-2 type transport system ATP-binding protein
MHQLIKETLIKQKKTTILLSTHDLNEAQELANHLVLLNKGKVVVEGNLAGLRQQLYKNKILNIEYAQKPQPGWHTDYTFTDLKQHETNLEIEGLPEERVPDIIRAFILHGGRITSCFFKDKSLEDIFTHLTKTGQ